MLAHSLDGPDGAPVVVLSNSLGTTPEMWDGQLLALAEHFCVLRYDHRGHGRSPVPPGPYTIEDLGSDLLAALDRLGIERASLCGLSLGGMVSMWVASEAPDRVDRLVLCNTSAYMGPPERWTERATLVREQGTDAIVDGAIERWLTPAGRGTRAEQRLRAMLHATPDEGYASCCEAVGSTDLRDRLAAIRAPTLVIAGADDPALPPERARRLADAIRGARLEVIERGAHLVNVERPEEFNRALLGHLAV